MTNLWLQTVLLELITSHYPRLTSLIILILCFQLIILSVLACSYADKLDRTYLPPASAGTAGGSPGALTAPNEPGFDLPKGPSSFGQPTPSGSAGFGQPNAGKSGFGQPAPQYGAPTGGAAAPSQGPSGFSQSTSQFGAPSGSGSSPAQGPSGFSQPASQYGAPSGSGSTPAQGPSGFSQPASQYGTPSGSGSAPAQGPSGFGPSANAGQQTFQFGAPAGGPVSGQNAGLGFGAQDVNAYSGQAQPERERASIDRNAEILRYENQNDGETFSYAFETSNGISAEESGVATNGVQAQGGFAYTGDDGQEYRITYTADENGYQPQGDHLPTPHPIPEEILKSIEENARAAAAGTQEGKTMTFL